MTINTMYRITGQPDFSSMLDAVKWIEDNKVSGDTIEIQTITIVTML
jgi:hypothetical protein